MAFLDKLWLKIQYNWIVLVFKPDGAALHNWLVKNRICMTVTGFRGDSYQVNPASLL